MKLTVFVLTMFFLAGEAMAEPAPAPPANPAASLRARLNEDVVRKAVRETLAAEPRERATAPTGQVLSGDRDAGFSRKFADAKKPSCLGPDATKFQPGGFSTRDWNFGLGGFFALPFWAAAIAQGKCN